MQRIGRVDRRLNPEIEGHLLDDHPDQQPLRGKIAFWNFLPPDGAQRAADSLQPRLAQDPAHLQDLRHRRPQAPHARRRLRSPAGLQPSVRRNHHGAGGYAPGVPAASAGPSRPGRPFDALPGRVFSGKRHPSPGARGVFLCYTLPAADRAAGSSTGILPVLNISSTGFQPVDKPHRQDACATDTAQLPWTEAAGISAWFYYDLDKEQIVEESTEIHPLIRCAT